MEEAQVNTILNRVKNDITKHIKDIQDKLHDIVKQIIMQQMSSWEAKPPIPSKSFQNICKYENSQDTKFICSQGKNCSAYVYLILTDIYVNFMRPYQVYCQKTKFNSCIDEYI